MSFEADLSASLSGEAGDGRHGSPTGAGLATRSQPRSRSAGVGYENAVDAEGRRVIWLNRAVVDSQARRRGESQTCVPPIIPNAETVEAMEAARRGELSGPFSSIDELMKHLHAED